MPAAEPLEFKPDMEDARAHWLAFWEQELIDRPCCNMRAPKSGVERVPGLPYMAGARDDFEPIIEQIIAHHATIYFGGDAMPAYTPSFGPDQFSAWLGAELDFSADGFGTNWAVPCIDDWEDWLPFSVDESNPWWQRILAFLRALAEAIDGKMILTHLDLHSNVDALSAMRLPGPLCIDMMDVPDTIDRAMQSVRELYVPIYEAIYEAGGMSKHGTQGWVAAYHPVRTNTIQCDFAALIGPEHFRRWVLPALEDEAAHLGHCAYHLDGPECLVHLDDLCAISGLDCIQWTTGARNKPFHEWLDLLKEIQAKGTSIWVPCNTEDIKIYHAELKPNMVFYDCSAPDEKTAEETLQWLIDHT